MEDVRSASEGRLREEGEGDGMSDDRQAINSIGIRRDVADFRCRM